jgi:hypothetical protein
VRGRARGQGAQARWEGAHPEVRREAEPGGEAEAVGGGGRGGGAGGAAGRGAAGAAGGARLLRHVLLVAALAQLQRRLDSLKEREQRRLRRPHHGLLLRRGHVIVLGGDDGGRLCVLGLDERVQLLGGSTHVVAVDIGPAVGVELDGGLQRRDEGLLLRELDRRGQRVHARPQPLEQHTPAVEEGLIERGQLCGLVEPVLELHDVTGLEALGEQACGVDPVPLRHRGRIGLAHRGPHLAADDGIEHGQKSIDAEREPAPAEDLDARDALAAGGVEQHDGAEVCKRRGQQSLLVLWQASAF